MSPRARLLLAAAVIAGVWQIPDGRWLLYPITLLATYAHELGHGLAALVAGNRFDGLELYANGAGLARYRGDSGPAARAFIAAGGLVGPRVAGALLLVLSRSPRITRGLLALLAALALICAALWSANWQAGVFAMACAAVCAAGARWLPAGSAAFAVNLVGLTLCLSLFQDLDYLFSDHALVGGQMRPSDSAVMAQALWLPYWFWGALVAAACLALTLAALWVATRPVRTATPAAGAVSPPL